MVEALKSIQLLEIKGVDSFLLLIQSGVANTSGFTVLRPFRVTDRGSLGTLVFGSSSKESKMYPLGEKNS